MTDPPYDLTPAGNRRKEQILALAVHQARRRGRRRIATRATLLCLVVAAAIPGLIHLLPHAGREEQVVQIRTEEKPTLPQPHPAPASRVLITRLQTDPDIIQRLAIPPRLPRWQTIGDDQFLQALSNAHHPAGLAYIDNRPMLLFRNEPPPERASDRGG